MVRLKSKKSENLLTRGGFVKRSYWGGILFLLSAGCSTVNQSSQENTSVLRKTAAESNCEVLNDISADDKAKEFISYHQSSIQNILNDMREIKNPLAADSIIAGKADNQIYAKEFIGGAFNYSAYTLDALSATARFLGPPISSVLGFRKLEPTFQNNCELFTSKETKMVHALGSLAEGRMILYPKIKKLGQNDRILGEIANPWTGLFQSVGNEDGVRLLLRFSVANPVGTHIWLKEEPLPLEFIPGLGIKFFIDGHRSLDLVAMESLAGQGSDHNFFKYEFSPDFSEHAPPDFSTASGTEKEEMLSRYNQNAINKKVMTIVGKRFAKVIPRIINDPNFKVDSHSKSGPHPFIMSIQHLAAYNKNGVGISFENQKRPWRLVFKPAIRDIEESRRSNITNPQAYDVRRPETDFRYKLTYLQPEDILYYVIAETESKARYKIGEIRLASSASPSIFADKLYFIQHQLDLRKSTFAKSIVNPSN